MLEDTGAAVLVAEESLAGQLPARAGLRDLRVELLRHAGCDPAARPRASPHAGLHPARSRRSRLRHLHLRLDRPAEGGGGPAPRRRAPGALRPTTSSSARRTGWRSPRTARSTPPPSRSGARCSNGARLVGVERETLLVALAPSAPRSPATASSVAVPDHRPVHQMAREQRPRGAGRVRAAPRPRRRRRGDRCRGRPRGAARAPVRRICSTSTGRPRRPPSPPGSGWKPCRRGRPCPSGGRSPTAPRYVLAPGLRAAAGRECRASSTWAARCWRAAISTGRT